MKSQGPSDKEAQSQAGLKPVSAAPILQLPWIASPRPLSSLIKVLHPKLGSVVASSGQEARLEARALLGCFLSYPVALIITLSSAYKPVQVFASQNILCEAFTPLELPLLLPAPAVSVLLSPLGSSSPCHWPFTPAPQITDSNKPRGCFRPLLSWLPLQNWTQSPRLETFSSLTFQCAALDWPSEPPRIPFLARFLTVPSCLLPASLPLHLHLPRRLLHLRVRGCP